MAMIDYGALLRVDGVLINRNEMFMEASDTGYVCKKATGKHGVEEIDGNYFVCAGDEHFLLVFYKGICKVISDGQIVYSAWGCDFISEEHFFENLPSVRISYLDSTLHAREPESNGLWSDYVKDNWKDADGSEHFWELQDGKREYRIFLRRAKKIARRKRYLFDCFKTRNYRFLAQWEHNGHHYEVIYGYGIDSDEEVWNEIKNDTYGFSKKETELIDNWFAC